MTLQLGGSFSSLINSDQHKEEKKKVGPGKRKAHPTKYASTNKKGLVVFAPRTNPQPNEVMPKIK